MADRPELARDRRNAVLRGIARTGRLPDAADLELLTPESRAAALRAAEAIRAVEQRAGRRLTKHRRALVLAAFLVEPALDLDVDEVAAVLAELPDFD